MCRLFRLCTDFSRKPMTLIRGVSICDWRLAVCIDRNVIVLAISLEYLLVCWCLFKTAEKRAEPKSCCSAVPEMTKVAYKISLSIWILWHDDCHYASAFNSLEIFFLSCLLFTGIRQAGVGVNRWNWLIRSFTSSLHLSRSLIVVSRNVHHAAVLCIAAPGDDTAALFAETRAEIIY